MSQVLITNDASVLGILFSLLGLIFYTAKSNHAFFIRLYKIFPPLLLCYFIPGLLNSFNIIDGENSKLYFVASRYLLPACLVLLTINIDMKAIKKLGPKALCMFFTGTFGIIIGGPIALFLFAKIYPQSTFLIDGASIDQLWRGMSTIAGSWIGGGANQTAMKEIFMVDEKIFSLMVVVDVLVANVWMAALLWMASRSNLIDEKNSADNSSIDELKNTLENYVTSNQRVSSSFDLMMIFAISFGSVGFCHLIADIVAPWIGANAPYLNKFSLSSSFFWITFLATTIGLILSFTPVRKLEGAGASKVGSVFLYVLVVSIGMKMNILEVFKYPELFLLGLIWIAIHAILLLVMARIIKAPVFFLAVGSQANVGGAASAPVVASAFHPSLSSVGVLLAVLGYALGTYGAWLCAILLKWVSKLI